MGGKRDLSARNTQKRQDDDARKLDIETVQKYIYDKNYAVNSEAVERVLAGKSVPIVVSLIHLRLLFKLKVQRMHFQLALLISDLIYLKCLSLISCTNSS